MNEPTRIIDSGSHLERRLLGTARAFEVSSEGRERTLEVLASGGVSAFLALPVAQVVASETAAAAAGKGALGVVAGVKSAVVAGAITIAGVGWLYAESGAPPNAPRADASSGVPRPSLAATSPQRLVADRVSAAASPPAIPSSPTVNGAAPAPAGPVPTKEPSSNLENELALLRAARNALAQEQPRRALDLLQGQGAFAPQSPVLLEREVLTIQALAASGESEAARRRARTFVDRHPHSILAERLRGLAGTADAPTSP